MNLRFERNTFCNLNVIHFMTFHFLKCHTPARISLEYIGNLVQKVEREREKLMIIT